LLCFSIDYGLRLRILYLIIKVMEYKVVLHSNFGRKKQFNTYKKYVDAMIKFRYLKGKTVHFPKKVVNSYGKLKPIHYTLYVIKTRVEDDEPRDIRDSMGRIITEEQPYDGWIIVDSCDFDVEEDVTVWSNTIGEARMDVVGIIRSILIRGTNNEKNVKIVTKLKNKIVLQDNKFMDILICKCPDDAKRLYDVLNNSASKTKIKNLLFMGNATDKVASDLYEEIQKVTGWSKERIWRTNTSH
jgi:hypothetical protein